MIKRQLSCLLSGMQTTYLCGLAVLLCLIFGGLIGLWVAHNDTVSKVVRPINDTLQTMPLCPPER